MIIGGAALAVVIAIAVVVFMTQGAKSKLAPKATANSTKPCHRHGVLQALETVALENRSAKVAHQVLQDIRGQIKELPEGFSFHDLRHYLASLLIASGADVKIVQARLRHALASTTLDTYGHLWPDADESTRAAVGKVIAARMTDLSDRDAERG